MANLTLEEVSDILLNRLARYTKYDILFVDEAEASHLRTYSKGKPHYFFQPEGKFVCSIGGIAVICLESDEDRAACIADYQAGHSDPVKAIDFKELSY